MNSSKTSDAEQRRKEQLLAISMRNRMPLPDVPRADIVVEEDEVETVESVTRAPESRGEGRRKRPREMSSAPDFDADTLAASVPARRAFPPDGAIDITSDDDIPVVQASLHPRQTVLDVPFIQAPRVPAVSRRDPLTGQPMPAAPRSISMRTSEAARNLLGRVAASFFAPSASIVAPAAAPIELADDLDDAVDVHRDVPHEHHQQLP